MSRKKVLFTDWRDIQCGAISWLTADGTKYGVRNPPEPQVDLHVSPGAVPHGIRLAAQPARKTQPVDDWNGWGRIISDQGAYRSWYLEINGVSKLGSGSAAHSKPPASVVICSVESKDGFNWGEPKRCEIKVPGQSDFDGLTFFVDPAAAPAERYKFVYSVRFPGDMFQEHLDEYMRWPPHCRDWRISDEQAFGMFAAVSPDGLSWTPLPEPILLHPSDTDTTVFRDEVLGAYVMYTRMYRDGRRWIGRAQTDDFTRWGPVEPIIWPRLDDPPDYDFYLNGYTRYPDLPEYQLMFPMVWHRYTERSEVRLYSSADGIAWNQIPGDPVIAPGNPGEWDSEFISSGKDLLCFGDDKVAIPYSGTRYPHKYPRWQSVWDAMQMAWAFWPRDRICAMVADREGEFWTPPMVPPGREIRLNCRTPLAGEIRVGVEGMEGRSVDDCDPIFGDSLSAPVHWRGQSDIGCPEGQPVTLHFKMRAAELFAFEWK